jgi:predicted RNA-binding Zn-ribbon protein involved in translation (DUF1610 family)
MSELRPYVDKIHLKQVCEHNGTYSFECPECGGLCTMFAMHPKKHWVCSDCGIKGYPEQLIKKLKRRFG